MSINELIRTKTKKTFSFTWLFLVQSINQSTCSICTRIILLFSQSNVSFIPCNLFLIYSWSSILPFMSYKVKPHGRRLSTANVNAIKGRRHWAQIPRRTVFNELKPSHTAIKTNDSKVNKENISGLNSYQWKSSCKNSSV